MTSRCKLPVLLFLLVLAPACARSAPCREPVSVAIPSERGAPPSAALTVLPATVTASPAFHLMSVSNYGEDEDGPARFVYFGGNRASMPYSVSREVAELLRQFAHEDIPKEQRAPYDEWAQRTLAKGGVFLRAEIEAEGDSSREDFVVLRGGRVEAVECPHRMFLPVAVLYDVPIYVEIKLLKAVGGWVPDIPR